MPDERFLRAMAGLQYAALSALLRHDPHGVVILAVVSQYMLAYLGLPYPPSQSLLARLAEEGQHWSDTHPLPDHE